MPDNPTPSETPEDLSWEEAKDREFDQLVQLTGSRSKALQVYRSTEPSPREALDRLLAEPTFPLFQQTREQIQDLPEQQQEDGINPRDLAHMSLVLQHGGLAQDLERGELFERLGERERRLKSKLEQERKQLEQKQASEEEPNRTAIEHGIEVLEVQLDDLYRQAQLCLEIRAMREEYDQLTQGEALSNENLLEAVAHRGRSRVEQIEDGLENRQPLAQIAALEVAREQGNQQHRRREALQRSSTDAGHNPPSGRSR